MNSELFKQKLLVYRTGIISKSFFSHNQEMKVELYQLMDLLDRFLKQSSQKEINKKVQALLIKLITIYNAWDKQDQGDSKDFNRLTGKMLGIEEYSMATLKVNIDEIVRALESSTKKGSLNYEDYIVSTDDHLRYLHKTLIDFAESIMNNGLKYGGTLVSTATMCPRDLSDAKEQFFKKHGGSDAAIIIEFPLKSWVQIKEKLRNEEDYESNPSVDPLFSEEIKSPSKQDRFQGFTNFIKPKFIVGYIDLRDNSVHLKPSRN